jgi:hypothetical protein
MNRMRLALIACTIGLLALACSGGGGSIIGPGTGTSPLPPASEGTAPGPTVGGGQVAGDPGGASPAGPAVVVQDPAVDLTRYETDDLQ